MEIIKHLRNNREELPMNSIVYFNQKFLPYDQVNIPLATHALHYGTGCFEGIRAYWNEKHNNLYIFRAKDHFLRLINSCKTLEMSSPGKADELVEITIELVKKNNFKENLYIRPIVFKSAEAVTSFVLDDLPDTFAIYAIPKGSMSDVSAGIKTIVSSWVRQDARMIPPFAKPTGIYLNTSLAKTEAHKKGADDAILLNLDSSVAEASAANLFLIKDGKLVTPATDQNILKGITRDTIIELAKKEFAVATTERKVKRDELFVADEVFICGTGLEVTPVIEIDGKKVGNGKVGELTKKLQELYFSIVRGDNQKYFNWLTSIY